MAILNIFSRNKRTSRFIPKKRINYQTQDRVRCWKIEKAFRNKWEKLKQVNNDTWYHLDQTNSERKGFDKSWLQNRYGEQLRNKQALKAFYGPMRDRTFKKYLIERLNTKNKDPIENFLQLMECRLETVLFRSGFFKSIFQRRQAILHSKVQICKRNRSVFKTVKHPGVPVQPGDILKLNASQSVTLNNRESPSNLTILEQDNIIIMNQLPSLSSITFPFKVDLKKILGWGRRY
jgi:small subunit ribosomal protein S4